MKLERISRITIFSLNTFNQSVLNNRHIKKKKLLLYSTPRQWQFTQVGH